VQLCNGVASVLTHPPWPIVVFLCTRANPTVTS
jgi:hypothetical protein